VLKKPAKAPKSAFEMKQALIDAWNHCDIETKLAIRDNFALQIDAYDLLRKQLGDNDQAHFLSLVLSYGMQSVMEGVRRSES
jgi:hypothetical protein